MKSCLLQIIIKFAQSTDFKYFKTVDYRLLNCSFTYIEMSIYPNSNELWEIIVLDNSTLILKLINPANCGDTWILKREN